uniref:Uncharacterized protein n=1 Tax=Anguilla anguilla TaxID=7936 RepID=A0A0E9QUU7_ANGAN
MQLNALLMKHFWCLEAMNLTFTNHCHFSLLTN